MNRSGESESQVIESLEFRIGENRVLIRQRSKIRGAGSGKLRSDRFGWLLLGQLGRFLRELRGLLGQLGRFGNLVGILFGHGRRRGLVAAHCEDKHRSLLPVGWTPPRTRPSLGETDSSWLAAGLPRGVSA